MATQFLRKIILEELQKVLKEQAGLEVWKSGQNRAKGYPSDTDPFGGQGPIDPSQAPLGSPLNPRDSAPFVDPQYTRSKSKPKRKPLKKSFTEKEIVDLSLNPKRIYSGHKAQYKTASGEVYSIKFDRTGKPDYGTIALLSAPKSVASVTSDKKVDDSMSFEPTPEPGTVIDPKKPAHFTKEEEEEIMRYPYKLGDEAKKRLDKEVVPESITREINKLLKML